MHTPHDCLCSILGPKSGRLCSWDQLRNVSGPPNKISSKPPKILQDRMDWWGEMRSLSLITFVPQHTLKHTEQPFSTWGGQNHGAKLSQQFLPLVHGGPTLCRRYRVQDFKEAEYSMGRQLNSISDGVDHPPQHHLASGPGCVYLRHIIDGSGLLVVGSILLVKRPKHRIKQLKQHMFNMSSMLAIPLDCSNKPST
jgi:hypothetical protein